MIIMKIIIIIIKKYNILNENVWKCIIIMKI